MRLALSHAGNPQQNIRRGHLSGAQFGSRAFAIWIDAIPELVDERLDDDGNPALYDRFNDHSLRIAALLRSAAR